MLAVDDGPEMLALAERVLAPLGRRNLSPPRAPEAIDRLLRRDGGSLMAPAPAATA